MKKYIYSEQAVVRIWRNTKNFANFPTAHFGHAAVTVAGNSVKSSSDGPNHIQNISFWPGGRGAGFGNANRHLPGDFSDFTKGDKVYEMKPLTALRLEVGTYQQEGKPVPDSWTTLLAEKKKAPILPRPGQRRAFDSDGDRIEAPGALTLKDGTEIDVPMFFQNSDNDIYLPGMLARGCRWGLNLTRMGDWWMAFKTTSPMYRALSPTENCVGVALKGLVEGGAASLVKPPEFRVYAEPVQLEKYAQQLADRFTELEGMARILDMGIHSDHVGQEAPHKFELKDGMWTFDAWKRESALGFFYSRSALICEIDRNLASFQKLTWKNDFKERFEAFVNIFLAVCRHRHDKSDSKRTEAVAVLGRQILAILQKHGFWDGWAPA